jgi:hypothetical protein
MGMFDYIRVEKKLPLSEEIKKAFPKHDWSKQDFQTKDLDNTMSYYTVRKNGELYADIVEGKHVRIMTKKQEEEAKKTRKFVWPYKFKETARRSEKQTFSGTLSFYDLFNDQKGNTWWIEFESLFIKGKLKTVTLVKGEIHTTAEENKKREAAWKKQMEDHETHLWTKTRRILNKVTCNYWEKSARKVAEGLGIVSGVFSRAQTWVWRNL